MSPIITKIAVIGFDRKLTSGEQRSDAEHHVNNDVTDDGDLEKSRVYFANKIIKIRVQEQEQEQERD